MMHLSADMIEKQQLAPAVMQQSHLISHLNHGKWRVVVLTLLVLYDTDLKLNTVTEVSGVGHYEDFEEKNKHNTT